jgi:hypothetical protein
MAAVAMTRPRPRVRGLRSLSERPALVVGAITLAAALLGIWFTTRVVRFEVDELSYTKIAIALGDAFQPFVTGEAADGRYNQLYPLLLAPLYALFSNPDAFAIAHVLNPLLMASTGIPAYLLAREVTASRAAAYLACALVAVAPWLTISNVLLSEVAAYPAGAWAFLFMHRAITRPSPLRDGLALLAIGVACYARLQLAVLLLAFVAAVVLHEAAYAWRGEGTWRQAGERLLRGHVVLVVAAALGALVAAGLFATGRATSVLGNYGNVLEGQLVPEGVWVTLQAYLVAMTLGVAVIPAILTVGLLLETLWRPRDRALHALVVLTALVVVAVGFQVANVSVRFVSGLVQERYTVVLAPLLVVCGVVAIVEARRRVFVALAGAVAVAALMAGTDYENARSAFWYLVSPAISTWQDIVEPRLSVLRGGTSPYLLGAFVVLVGGAVLAVLLRALDRGRALLVLGAVLVAGTLAQTVYSLDQVVFGEPDAPGYSFGLDEDLDWIDARVGSDTDVDLLTRQLGSYGETRGPWWEAQYWNRSIRGAFAQSEAGFYVAVPLRGVRVDAASGRYVARGAPPRYVVAATSGVPSRPVGRVVARGPEERLALFAVDAPFRAAWSVVGLSDDGFLPLRDTATLRAHDVARGACARLALTFTLPEGVLAEQRVRVAGAGRARTVPLGAASEQRVPARACRRGDGPATVTLSARAPADAPAYAAITPRLERVQRLG